MSWLDSICLAPKLLWLLLILVAPLAGFLWWAWRRKQELMTQFISARLLVNLKVGVSPRLQKARLGVMVAAVALIVIALARPYWGSTTEEVRQHGLDIIVAIDTSNSMLAEDVSPTRLARAKLSALDLMRKARTDRLGLVAFAGDAFLECPLTLDDGAFSQSVNALDTKTISQGGTAIFEAIEEARKAFKNEPDSHKVLVLFTDGEDHDNNAVAAAKKAADDGIVIFTVGIGSAEGEKLPIRDQYGHVNYIMDDTGKPVVSKLNESLLKDIARTTKGFYLQLRGATTMDTLYDRGIAPLPKSEGKAKSFKRFNERYRWFLFAAIILLIVEMFMMERRRRRSLSPPPVPKSAQRPAAPRAPSPPPLPTGLAIIFLLGLPLSLMASPASALKEYNAGDYEKALKDYNQLLEKKQNDPRLHFNAGAAAYQSHQLDTAAKEFSEALSSPGIELPLQERAYYNLGNTQYRAGQDLQDTEKKQKAWENALQNYASSLKLNPQDKDAAFNQQFVKKQLEELKKQQQQQQQQNKSDKNQNKKDQPKKDQQKNQDQQNQQDQKNQQDKNQKDQQSQQDQSKQDQQKSDEEKQKEDAQKQAADQQQPDQKNGGQPKDNQGQPPQSEEEKQKAAEDAKKEAAMMAAGQMTPSQAQKMLDAYKNDEKVFQIAPTNRPNASNRPFKNW